MSINIKLSVRCIALKSPWPGGINIVFQGTWQQEWT